MNLPYTENPAEVWEAVCGNPQPLVDLMRSGDALTKETREAMALWLLGEIPPKRLASRPKAMRAYDGNIPPAVWVHFAVDRYKRVAVWLKARGKMYGQSEALIAAIAKKNGINQEVLTNAIRSGLPAIPEATTSLIDLFLIWQNARKK